MGIETKPWNVVDHLDGDDAVLAYLEAVFEDGEPALIAAALNDLAGARQIPDAALTDKADLSSVIQTLKKLGFELTAKAA